MGLTLVLSGCFRTPKTNLGFHPAGLKCLHLPRKQSLGQAMRCTLLKKKLLAKVSCFFTAEQISLGRFILHHFIRIHSAYRIKDILTKYTDNTNMVL